MWCDVHQCPMVVRDCDLWEEEELEELLDKDEDEDER